MAETLAQIHEYLSSVNSPGSCIAGDPEPADWVLRLAQGALLWGASRFSVQSEGGFLWITISQIPGIAQLYADYQKDRYLQRALQEAGPFTRSLALFFQVNPEETYTVDFSPVKGQAEPENTPRPCLVVRAQWDPKVILANELRERLRFSPLPVFVKGSILNKPFLHQTRDFSKEVHADQEAGLRRNFVERIWLSDGPISLLMAVADPLESSAQRRSYHNQLYTGAPGTTNLQEFRTSKTDPAWLASPRPSQPLAWKNFPPNYYEYFETVSGGILFTTSTRRAITAGAVLRWGRPQRGPGLLFIIEIGLLQAPIRLGPEFVGCWAFVTVPGEPDSEARQAVLDWTRWQFCDMAESLNKLINQGKAEELGIRFNFVSEVKAAVERFQTWSGKQWGSPLDDF